LNDSGLTSFPPTKVTQAKMTEKDDNGLFECFCEEAVALAFINISLFETPIDARHSRHPAELCPKVPRILAED
jgi:hypothetical protein